MERNIHIPQGGPPPGGMLSPDLYKLMGQENIYRMLEDFYMELGQSAIKDMFPNNLKEASHRSAAFFVSVMGGPPLYQQLYGPPMMRKRHLPFVIDEKARQVWLGCFKKILQNSEEKYHFPPEHLNSFIAFLERFSAWMVNQA